MKSANPKGRTVNAEKTPTRDWGFECGCSIPNFEHMTILMN